MSSSNNAIRSKKNLGRRKVNMEKIKNESNLRVTFSKRREGVFKKASELCTLTGAEAGLVVFSPGNKAYSFGHPNINTIADRFLTQTLMPVNHVQQGSIPTRAREDEYLALLEKQLEVEKARRKELKKQSPVIDLDKLNYDQLVALREKVVEFGKTFEAWVKEAEKPPVMSNNVVPRDATFSGGMENSDDVAILYDLGATSIDEDYPSPPPE